MKKVNTSNAISVTTLEPGLIQRAFNAIAGWFGPGNPQPQVAPQGTPPRRYDYGVGQNLTYRPRSTEGIGFEMLRNFADYWLVRAVIETRKDQICRMPYKFRLKAEPGETKKATVERSLKDASVQKLAEFFQFPDKEHDFHTWLRIIVEDLLVLDAPTVYPRKTTGGEMYALVPFDGATINRLIDNAGLTPMPPANAFQQIIKGVIAGEFTSEELFYKPRNPRSHKLYGFGPVEQSILFINLALRRTLHQLAFYTEGNVPEALAQVPEDWTPDQIQQFQDWFDGLLAGDSGARRRIHFVPKMDGIQFTRPPDLKDEMDEFIARVVCFFFSIPPTAFVKMVNRASGQQMSETAQEEGIEPLAIWAASFINQIVQSPYGFNLPNCEFAWEDEAEVDQLKQAQIDEIEVKNGITKINEVRARKGQAPVDGGDEAYVFTATGPVPLAHAIEQANIALENARNPQPEPGQDAEGKTPPKGAAAEKLAKKKVCTQCGQPNRQSWY